MENMTFREAQLCIKANDKELREVFLPEDKQIYIGDGLNIVAINTEIPYVVVRAEGLDFYCSIVSFSDNILAECIKLLREVARGLDE